MSESKSVENAEDRLPQHDLNEDEEFTPELIAALEEADRDFAEGRVIDFDSVDWDARIEQWIATALKSR